MPRRLGDSGELEGDNCPHAVAEQIERAYRGPVPGIEQLGGEFGDARGSRMLETVSPLRVLHDVGVDAARGQRGGQRPVRGGSTTGMREDHRRRTVTAGEMLDPGREIGSVTGHLAPRPNRGFQCRSDVSGGHLHDFQVQLGDLLQPVTAGLLPDQQLRQRGRCARGEDVGDHQAGRVEPLANPAHACGWPAPSRHRGRRSRHRHRRSHDRAPRRRCGSAPAPAGTTGAPRRGDRRRPPGHRRTHRHWP